MGNRLVRGWAYHGLRILLGGAFVLAGALKLASPEDFARIVAGFGLVPEPLIHPLALALPVLEILAGIGLALDLRGSLGLTVALLGLFTAVVAHGLRLGLDIDCGCFGPDDPLAAYHSLWTTLWRDAAMLAACACLYAIRRVHGLSPWTPAPRREKPFTTPEENTSCAN